MTKNQYDRFAGEYDKAQQAFSDNQGEDSGIEYLFAAATVDKNLVGKVVLDVGCGPGRQMQLYEQLGAKEVWGIDQSIVMVKIARDNVSHPERVIHTDVHNLDMFQKGKFDAILGRFFLHHVDDIDSAYGEMARVMKKGATLAQVVHHPFKDVSYKSSDSLYGDGSDITVKLFGKLDITFPSHTIEDYFSLGFFKYFDLQYLTEFPEDKAEAKVDPRIPRVLAYSAIRR